MEDRYFYVREDVTKKLIRIGVCPCNPYVRKSQWQPGTVRKACEEVLTRMNIPKFQRIQTKSRMVVNVPPAEGLKEFDLNNAIQEAVSILLKPSCTIAIIPDTVYANGKRTRSKEVICVYSAEHKFEDRSVRNNYLNKQRYFIVKMASIAWDFLNISNIFPQ